MNFSSPRQAVKGLREQLSQRWLPQLASFSAGLLGELDAVVHFFVHSEIQKLCGLCLRPELIATAGDLCDEQKSQFGFGNTPAETFNSN